MAKKAKSQIKPHMIPSPIARTLAEEPAQAQDESVVIARGHGEKRSDKIIHAHDWKWHTHYHPDGYFEIQTEDLGDVPVRLFFTQRLLDEAEDALGFLLRPPFLVFFAVDHVLFLSL